MNSSLGYFCTVQVKLELGHRAQLRKKMTSEGFTHDWMVFVRGPETGDIQHFVEKVVFRLHESFPKPKRVCKEPPYKVEESGYAGFLMPIEPTHSAKNATTIIKKKSYILWL
uniref:YEATS domain-containing protein n=1 Tax=Periophthalmus magnuspinnatus TaxID=409849 RepID=A0A3B3ZTH5_9GOBI